MEKLQERMKTIQKQIQRHRLKFNQRRKKRYHYAREHGLTSYEANMLKNLSLSEIKAYIKFKQSRSNA